MVKIVNGEILEDHDPRVRSLQLSQTPQPQLEEEQQNGYGYSPPPYAYYTQYAAYQQGAPPPPYPSQYLHHSPFAYDDPAQPDVSLAPASPHPPSTAFPPSSHLGPPPSPSPLTAPSLAGRRLSFSSSAASSSLPGASSPALAHRRLSFSSSSSPSLPPPPSLSHPTHPVLPSQPPLHYPRRSPSSYNLFGLPSLMISDIPVKPHVYLLAGLLLYFIGPPVLVPLLASFFFYRWHLNKEAEKKEKERLEAKFSVFRERKTRPREAGKVIHSLKDLQG